MNENLKTIPLLLEVVERPEGKVTYIIRQAQNGAVAAICDSADDVAKFLVSLTAKIENESNNEKSA